MSEDEYIDWEVPQCDNCVRTAHHAILLEEDHETPEKWVCVGNIPKPNDPNNPHDLANKIRICVMLPDKTIKQFEWTPYEAGLVSAFLTMAITNELFEKQPYRDSENNLIIAE